LPINQVVHFCFEARRIAGPFSFPKGNLMNAKELLKELAVVVGQALAQRWLNEKDQSQREKPDRKEESSQENKVRRDRSPDELDDR
jgi:hypothetical protein